MPLSKKSLDLNLPTKRKESINVVEIHIYNWPMECWDFEKNHGWLNMSKYAESIGIIKEFDQLNLKETRNILLKQNNPIKKFTFLKNVGRTFTRIYKEQEPEFKLRHFVNDSEFSNELFLLSTTTEEFSERFEEIQKNKLLIKPNKRGNLKSPMRFSYQNSPNLLNRKRELTPMRSRARSPPLLLTRKRSESRVEISSNDSLSQSEKSSQKKILHKKPLTTSNEEKESEKSSENEEKNYNSLHKIKKKIEVTLSDEENYSNKFENEKGKTFHCNNRLSQDEYSSEESDKSGEKSLKYDSLNFDDSNMQKEQNSDESSLEEKRIQDKSDKESENYQKFEEMKKLTKNMSLINYLSKNYSEQKNQKKSKMKSPVQANISLKEKLEKISHQNIFNSDKMKLLKELLQNIKKGMIPNNDLISKMNDMGLSNLYRYNWKSCYEKECLKTDDLNYYIRKLNDQFVATKCINKSNKNTFQSNLYPPSDKMNYMISIKILKDEIAELKRRIRAITVSVKEEEIKRQKNESLVPHFRLERNNLNAEMVVLRKKYPKLQMQNDFNKYELETFIN